MIYIILAMVCYAVATLFIASSSRHTNSNLTAALTNLLSAIIPVVIVIPYITKKNIVSQKFGITMAIIAGILVAFFGMAISKAYAVNKVGVVAPLVFGGAIFISTILSYFIFKEKVSYMQLAGLVLLALGFGVITYARATGR